MTAGWTVGVPDAADRTEIARLDPGHRDAPVAALQRGPDGAAAACLTVRPAPDLDEPGLGELTVLAGPGTGPAVPQDVLAELVAAARKEGLDRVAATVAGADADGGEDEEAVGRLAAAGFTRTVRLAEWRRPAGAPAPEAPETRFVFRPFTAGEQLADAMVGLASATFGAVLFPAPERLIVRADTLRAAVFGPAVDGGGPVGSVLLAVDGWPAVGWSLVGDAADGWADLALAFVQPGYEGQGVAAGLLAAAAGLAAERGVGLRTFVDAGREAELAAALPGAGFAESGRTDVWLHTA